MMMPQTPTQLTSLATALLASAETMERAERDSLTLLLSLAAGQLSPDGRLPRDPDQAAALRTVIQSLARLQPHGAHVPRNGIAYRGRPAFLTDDLLQRLRDEARVVRRRAVPQTGHLLGRGGPLADRLAASPEMIALVERTTVPVTATNIASYLFYETEGAGLAAHVDTEIFSLNVNLMLEHTSTADRTSFLYIYTMDGDCEQIVFPPGEIILTYADSVVHGRAPLARGEYVNNLTIGFQPR